jgi:putative ABC transport system permease protein
MSWRRFWRRKRRDQELTRELESYLAHEADLQTAKGLSAEDAGWAAQRKLGNRTALKEKVWEMNSLNFLESVWQDIHYAVRLLRTNSGFFVVATISLALGIGANTAIFQLLDAVRLRMLPVEHPEQLVELTIAKNEHCCSGNFADRHPNLTSAQWEQIRTHQQAFSSIFAWADDQFNLNESGEVRFANGLYVTGDTFKTLAIAPLVGRLIDSGDDTSGCGSPGVVISFPFWQRYFGGDATVVGKTVLLDSHRFEVMGVTPASFFGLEVGRGFDVALPACAETLIGAEQSHTKQRSHWWLAVIGRLKPGWTLARAEAQVKTISPAVFEPTVPEHYGPQDAKYYTQYKLTAQPAGLGVSNLRSDYETPLLLLLGIAGFVLLIACGNLANLTLARASVREREMAVRLAIGAGRVRLIRQLLSESLLLTISGTTLGVLLAQLLCRYMLTLLITDRNQVVLTLTPDWRLLAFTAAVAILTCLLFGLTPALRATRTVPAGAMKSAGRGLTASRERFSLRRALVIGQVALSLLLLVASLLFVRSLRNLTTLDTGLKKDGLLIMGVDLSALKLTSERRAATYRDLLANVRSAPGIDSASSGRLAPLSGNSWSDMIEIPGVPSHERRLSWFNGITSGYFQTLGVKVVAGRDFNEHDTPSSPEVAIVNQEFCRKFLNGENPLGKPVRLLTGPGEPPHQYQIVGLVKDFKYQFLRETNKPVVFVAETQRTEAAYGNRLLVRSHLRLGALMETLKQAAQKTNPRIPFVFLPFDTQIQDSLLRDRLMATLSSFFGFLAAALATVGLYGVISYMVERRRGEIGIRMALGATRGSVMRLILKEAGLLLLVGLVVGAVLALTTSQAAEKLLFGLKPTDPLTIALAVALLAAVASLASFVPAMRAARTEPMAALREE